MYTTRYFAFFTPIIPLFEEKQAILKAEIVPKQSEMVFKNKVYSLFMNFRGRTSNFSDFPMRREKFFLVLSHSQLLQWRVSCQPTEKDGQNQDHCMICGFINNVRLKK